MAAHHAHHHDEVALRNKAVPALESLHQKLLRLSSNGILSSKQPAVAAATEKELVNVIPPDFAGVTRWFIPVAPRVHVAKDGDHRFYSYFAVFQPNTVIPEHSHGLDIAELILVISGSIFFENQEHTTGDWLWIPSGKPYSIRAGDKGAHVMVMWPSTQSAVEVAGKQLHAAHDSALGIVHAIDKYVDIATRHAVASSRDPVVVGAMKKLEDVLPHSWPGVQRCFMPFASRAPDVQEKIDGRFLAYVAYIEPNTTITEHSHPIEKQADLRVVLQGSIIVDGKEHTAGDWTWIPAGVPYSFKTGKAGALTFLGWCWN